MFTLLGPHFLQRIREATKFAEARWTEYKTSIQRRVLQLPPHVARTIGNGIHHPLVLSLPNSETYLKGALREYQQIVQPHSGTSQLAKDFDPSRAVPQAISNYLKTYQYLEETECDIVDDAQYIPQSTLACEERCSELSQRMKVYTGHVATAYDNNPEEKSIMLLALMEMWMSMDKCAIRVYPLLKDFAPKLTPVILVRCSSLV